MLFQQSLVAFVAGISTVAAQYKGFNYGSTFTDGSAKVQTDYEAEFKAAAGLVGTSGFTSARLYTMIQAGTANTPSTAIPAAISTNTTLLLGLWASAGQDSFNNELAALSSALTQYGTSFTNLIVGISVGSEDLYRNSVQGIINKSGIGANPDTIVSYITQVRNLIKSTAASTKAVGHVDTWNDWTNSSNSAVITAVDFLGVDAYSYFETTLPNSISDGLTRFNSAYAATVAAAAGKPVWVTETGFPVSGATSGAAVPSLANAKTYWDQVGCGVLFGKVNTWWYTLQDAAPTTPDPSFGIVGSTLSSTPLFDLSCSNLTSDATTSTSNSTSSASGSSANSTAKASSKSSTALAAASGTPVVTVVTSNGVRSTLTLTSTAAGNAAATGASTPTGTGTGSSASASTTPLLVSNGAGSVSAGVVGSVIMGLLQAVWLL